MAVVELDGTLAFDTDYGGDATKVYEIATDYRTVIDIMVMYESDDLIPQDKTLCMLRMFYLDNIPADMEQAAELAMRFLDCDESSDNTQNAKTVALGKLFSWEQDGNYIYAGVNQSHDHILERVPDLHWWLFKNCMWNLQEGCRFNEIVSNRAAHKQNKATKEQKQARKDYPEIYVLRSVAKASATQINKLKQFESMLNN